MNNSLVFLSNNNLPLTTTVIIADSLDKRHTDVLALTHKYENELRNFGSVPFKTELKKAGIHGAQQEAEYAYLNEQQATLLISMMRNCPKVITFKIALVKAFYEMRQALAQHSHTYSPDEIAHIKEKALKQGYAIACSQFKKQDGDKFLKNNEIALPQNLMKGVCDYLEWSAQHRDGLIKLAGLMSEQSKVLMLLADKNCCSRAVVCGLIQEQLKHQ